jgi:uncharacterized OB-fold protein
MSEKTFVPVTTILPAIPCQWTVGVYLERFYQDLSEKRITGIKCKKCKKVYVPPRQFCGCGTKMEKFVKVKDTGTLVNYTVAYQNVNGSRREKPLVIGLIKLDGADTAVWGEVRVTPATVVETGMRLKAVFVDEPASGKTVESLSHFAPAGKK